MESNVSTLWNMLFIPTGRRVLKRFLLATVLLLAGFGWLLVRGDWEITGAILLILWGNNTHMRLNEITRKKEYTRKVAFELLEREEENGK